MHAATIDAFAAVVAQRVAPTPFPVNLDDVFLVDEFVAVGAGDRVGRHLVPSYARAFVAHVVLAVPALPRRARLLLPTPVAGIGPTLIELRSIALVEEGVVEVAAEALGLNTAIGFPALPMITLAICGFSSR